MSHNIYYEPAAYGLCVVAEVDYGGDWEYDRYVVFEDTATKTLGWLHDAGCSCPVPFEDARLDDMNYDMAALNAAIRPGDHNFWVGAQR